MCQLCSEDSYDIQKAKQILNDDHYGMEEIKVNLIKFYEFFN